MKLRVHTVAIVAAWALAAAQAMAQQPGGTAQSAPAATPSAPVSPEIARVAESNGRAMLNRATLYKAAEKDQRLQAGDRLVVLENGIVKVQYDSGCTVTIDSPQVYTISATVPCAPGVAERGVRAAAPVAGTGATGAASGSYVKWGLVALGIATPLLLLSDSNQGRPISP